MLQQLDAAEIDVGNTWLSKAMYFTLDGFAQMQNLLIWGMKKPHVALPSSLRPVNFIVWVT